MRGNGCPELEMGSVKFHAAPNPGSGSGVLLLQASPSRRRDARAPRIQRHGSGSAVGGRTTTPERPTKLRRSGTQGGPPRPSGRVRANSNTSRSYGAWPAAARLAINMALLTELSATPPLLPRRKMRVRSRVLCRFWDDCEFVQPGTSLSAGNWWLAERPSKHHVANLGSGLFPVTCAVAVRDSPCPHRHCVVHARGRQAHPKAG